MQGAGPREGWRRTTSWEDPRLLRALAPEGREVGVFEASGDDALALVAAGAGAVHAVVPDEAAAALVELKLAAAGALPVQSARAILGFGDFGRRIWFYHYVRANLPERIRAFWDAHEDVLRAGVADAGRVERGVRRAHRAFALVGGTELARVLADAGDEAARRASLADRWGLRARSVARVALPGLALLAGAPTDGAADRFAEVLARVPLADSPFASQLLLGERGEDAVARGWLAPDALGRVAARVGSVRVYVGSRGAWLETAPKGEIGVVLGREPLAPAEAAAVRRLLERGGRALGWGPAPAGARSLAGEDRGIFPGEPWVAG